MICSYHTHTARCHHASGTDREYIEKNGITDVEKYLNGFIEEYNKTAVPYKKITVLKVRTEDFPKNTLRKIMRFKIDMTID